MNLAKGVSLNSSTHYCDKALCISSKLVFSIPAGYVCTCRDLFFILKRD